MRHRKAFFSITVAPAAVLLAGTVAMADGPATSCSVGSGEGATVFTVVKGPTFVPCGEGSDQCTEIQYRVTGTFGPVYALEGKGVESVFPFDEGTVIGEPCFGVDGFGQGACHEQAVRTFPGEGGTFTIRLAGQRSPSPTSIAIASEGEVGFFFEACGILGLGVENTPNPHQLTPANEKVNFKGCVAEFVRDPATGDVVSAQLTEDSPENCTSPFLRTGRVIAPQPVGDVQLKLKLKDESTLTLTPGKFGDGYISTGTDSCTTRIIGGRCYTWCN